MHVNIFKSFVVAGTLLSTIQACPMDPLPADLLVGSNASEHSILTKRHNGCGPKGFGWLFREYKFHDCCNAHDDCWQAYLCDKDRLHQCNDAFEQCMLATCDREVGQGSHLPMRKCQRKAHRYHKWVDSKLAIFIGSKFRRKKDKQQCQDMMKDENSRKELDEEMKKKEKESQPKMAMDSQQEGEQDDETDDEEDGDEE